MMQAWWAEHIRDQCEALGHLLFHEADDRQEADPAGPDGEAVSAARGRLMDLVDLAEHLRNRGMSLAARAEDFVQPDFAQAAYIAIRAVALRQELLHVDDIRRQCLIEPSHFNSWGAVWMRAIRDGLIERTGQYRKSTDPKKHAHQYPIYLSLIVKRAPMEKPLMECSVMSTALQSRRERLWFPANGIASSELDVLSAPGLRRKKAVIAEKLRRIERGRQLYQMTKKESKIIERAKTIPLVTHRNPQPYTGPVEPPLIDGDCRWPVTIRDICRASCRHYDVNLLDFVSNRRHAKLVRARQVAMYIARTHTTRSYPEMGRIMGGRDHTTILFGVRKIESLLPDDEKLRGDVDAIVAMLSVGGGAMSHGLVSVVPARIPPRHLSLVAWQKTARTAV
jgi:hypothetical protein